MTALRAGALLPGAVLLGAMLAAPAGAHHSFAMFDQTTRLALQGTVREFQWTNPHAWIHLEVARADGDPELWRIELNSPNNLRRQGWRAHVLKPGDPVKLVLNPLKDGTHGGLFVSVTLADGTVLGDPLRTAAGPINVPTAPSR